MFRTFILVLFAGLFSLNSNAEETMSTQASAAKVDAAAAQLSQDMNKAVGQLGETISETAPAVIDSLAEMMKEMVKLMAPTMAAIQEGKNLPVASNEMAESMKQSINEKYTASSSHEINAEVNELKIAGEYQENGTTLKYEMSRNLAQTMLIQDMLDGTAQTSVLGEEAEIENLDGEDVPMSKFETFDINGVPFVGYDDAENKTIYLLSNVGAYVSLRMQAKGDEYLKVAQEFIYGFDYDAVKKSVSDDGRSIRDVKDKINESLNDPEKLKELMTQAGNKI